MKKRFHKNYVINPPPKQLAHFDVPKAGRTTEIKLKQNSFVSVLFQTLAHVK